MTPDLFDLSHFVPELITLGGAIVLLMVGLFFFQDPKRAVYANGLAILVLLASLGFMETSEYIFASKEGILSHLVFISPLTQTLKILIVGGAIVVLCLSLQAYRQELTYRFEFPVLILLSVAGMMVLVSSNNLMSLYMGLELMSLPLYVLAAFQRDEDKSTEAGLKYFVLGALSSGMILYGASLIYGFSGAPSLAFTDIAATLPASFSEFTEAPYGLLFGLMFVLAGLCFKVSAAPFHMWTPDVYQGAPTVVTAFLALSPKVAALGIFINILFLTFGVLSESWQNVVMLVAVLSMIVGAVGAIAQTQIKRLLAYSSIGHMGYILASISANTPETVQAVLAYLVIYLTMTAGVFACLIMLRHKNKEGVGGLENIADLAGLSKTSPAVAAMIAIFMFSMAGIPPLAGFFAKFYVFFNIVEAGYISLAIIGVLTSVVSAFYYLRVVKLMYFDETATGTLISPARLTWGVAALAATYNVLLFLYPTFGVNIAFHSATPFPF